MSLPVDLTNTIQHQAAASSTTLLGSAGVFNSGWIPNGGFARITGYASSAQAGTITVLQADNLPGSSAGATTNSVTSATVAVTGGTPVSFSVEAVAGYFFVKYTNGATAQTTFFLSTNLRRI